MRSFPLLAQSTAQALEGSRADTILRAVRESAAALGRRARVELAARRAARDLAQLDDRILRDIGLERWQIELIVRDGRRP